MASICRLFEVLCVFFVALEWNAAPVTCYKDVVIIHGVMGSSTVLDYLSDYISRQHPGQLVHNLNLYPGYQSLHAMWYQVQDFLQNVSSTASDGRGIHVIGYSQGGLIARGVVQAWDNHTVSSLISLSSPQAGQFGDGFLHLIYPSVVRDEAYRIFYSRWGQHTSVGGYWNDPHHQDLFLNYSLFLAPLNNDVITEASKRFKNNILRLERLVLIGGPDDGVIGPWQSAQFGFYDANLTVNLLRERDTYWQDRIGLKSLDKRKALVIKTYSGIHHHDWHHSVDVIEGAILPYLD